MWSKRTWKLTCSKNIRFFLKIIFLESTVNRLSVDGSLFRTLWFIELQGPLLQKLEFITVWKLYFWNLRSIGFLWMPHCCIKRQCLDIKSKLESGCVIEKDWKLTFFCFEPYDLLNFKAPSQQKLEFSTVWKWFRTLWFIELQGGSKN